VASTEVGNWFWNFVNVSFKDGTARVEKSKYLVDTKEDNLVAQLKEKEKKAFGTQSPFAVRFQSNLCLLNLCSFCIVRKCFYLFEVLKSS
jgi:predicted metal-binding protein